MTLRSPGRRLLPGFGDEPVYGTAAQTGAQPFSDSLPQDLQLRRLVRLKIVHGQDHGHCLIDSTKWSPTARTAALFYARRARSRKASRRCLRVPRHLM